MSKLSFFIVSLVVAAASAFVPQSQIRHHNVAFVATKDASSLVLHAEDTYWDGEYPPSKVLGPVMSKMPSALLGVASIVLLSVCAVSLFQTSLLVREPGAIASGEWVKWYYVLGSFMGPISWGTHVASWIQRKNGM